VAKWSKAWIVEFDADAVVDFEDVKSRGDRKAVELRPRQGVSEARLIYVRLGERFVVLAVAAKKNDFERAVAAAADRLGRRRGD
jgi:hypothetical protein